MRTSLFILFAVSALAKEPCKGVEVLAISGYLHPLPQASFTFTGLSSKVSKTVITRADGRGCLDLPLGDYLVKVAAAGFEPRHQSFEMDATPAVLPVSLRLGRVDNPTLFSVRGELKGFPRRNVWIVMSHILAQERYTTRLGTDGKFEIKGQLAGLYEVRAVSEGKILACTTLEKTGGDQWVDLNPTTVCGGRPR